MKRKKEAGGFGGIYFDNQIDTKSNSRHGRLRRAKDSRQCLPILKEIEEISPKSECTAEIRQEKLNVRRDNSGVVLGASSWFAGVVRDSWKSSCSGPTDHSNMA